MYRRIFLRALAALAVFAAVGYIEDDLSLRYKIQRNRQPFGTVTVKPYYAIHEKNGKTEYDFGPPETRTCAHSLFPHFGYQPCWYVNRHTEKRIDI